MLRVRELGVRRGQAGPGVPRDTVHSQLLVLSGPNHWQTTVFPAYPTGYYPSPTTPGTPPLHRTCCTGQYPAGPLLNAYGFLSKRQLVDIQLTVARGDRCSGRSTTPRVTRSTALTY